MRIEEDIKLDFKDVLIRPKRSALGSRKEVYLTKHYVFRHSKFEWHGVPIMAANMDGVGTLSMARSLWDHRMFTCLVKTYNEDELCDLATTIGGNHFAVSTGTSDSDFLKLRRIINAYPEIHFICIDVANGYQERFGDYVQKVREALPHCTIIAGNVVTADMTQELILRGADIIKVGIGPGSVCTTRIQTGVGYPQLSAVIECADAAHGLGGHIIADGGCTCPGDVAKAFGAGADFVMLGGMLSGHDEGEGEVISEDGKNPRVRFYGMSSDTAMEKHHGGVAEYRSSEGRTVEVPYRGPVKNTILDLLGGIRSTCTYVGAPTLKQLPKCTTFIRVNRQINDVFLK
jgi:GMP reductase